MKDARTHAGLRCYGILHRWTPWKLFYAEGTPFVRTWDRFRYERRVCRRCFKVQRRFVRG